MTAIVRRRLESRAGWPEIAALVAAWADERGLDLRSVVLLAPFLHHLTLARKAFAARGGWQPRVETTRTLAASLGPAPRAGEGQITFDAAIDRLQAARMLRGQSWVSREPLAFDEAVSALVLTAHAVLRAAAAVPPMQRAAHWQRARELLAPVSGVGVVERGLARMAVEWAATSAAPATDVLFDLAAHAWVIVQAGGADPLVQRLIEARPESRPCLVLDADAAVRDAFSPSISLARCEGFEDEAVCAAAQVLACLGAGQTPVALVAQDRLLMRRVRALLERRGVALHDETGWKLSTTRAAAQLMALLRAASPQASTDLLLDWLKASGWPQGHVAQVEAACRRHGWTLASSVGGEHLSPQASALAAEAAEVLQPLAGASRQRLSQWLAALRVALDRSGMLGPLSEDEAGAHVLGTLHLDEPQGWSSPQAALTSMSLAEFTAWVDAALEDASFVPEPPPDASVVVAPLAQLMLRPFAAIVFPGADDHRLGADTGPHALLSDSQAAAVGVPTRAQRRDAEALAFAHVTSGQAPVSLFYRHADGGEPLAASPLVEQLSLRLVAAGREFMPWADPRETVRLAPTPVDMPAPHAPALLPERLSASACEALRACPYRFHALHLLRVREAEELEDEIEQRDYGNWLHEVLLKFHAQRIAPAAHDVELARLLAIAADERERQGLHDADFLPYEAGFIDLAPRYIAWLHARDAQGAAWWQGEQEREVAPPEWEGVRLYGRIDRMDHVRGDDGPALELIDYKTGSAAALRQKLRQPWEDTQLAFYAALMQPEAGRPIQASYLTLGREIETLAHPDVEDSARALVAGVAQDLARIRRGAGMPALGQPPVCDYCEARGLCRRDHWSPV